MEKEPNQNPTPESQTSQPTESNHDTNKPEGGSQPEGENTASQSNMPDSRGAGDSCKTTNAPDVSAEPTENNEGSTPSQPSSPQTPVNKRQKEFFNSIPLKNSSIQDFFSKTKEPEGAEKIHLSKTLLKTERDESEEENEFYYIPIESLKTQLKIVYKEIDIKNKEDDDCTDKIAEIVEELRCTTFGPNQRALRRERQKYEKDRDFCRALRKKLENQARNIKKALERQEAEQRKGGSGEGNESSDSTQSISAKSLFKDDDKIVNTLLYVATFFPSLSPNEFKRVVSIFLKGITIEITKQQKVIEEEKTRIIEIQEEVSLVDIWEKSFSQLDKLLEKCFIKVSRKEKSSLVLDFSLSYLRSELQLFFQEEQPLYVEEQFKRTQVLLFDPSEKVADRAIYLLTRAAVDDPNVYGADWLLAITETVERTKSELLFERLSKLIEKMQIELDSSQSNQIINTFFDHLLLAKPDYAFQIILRLIFRHLCSTWLLSRLKLSKQLLDWLKRVVDQAKQEDKVNAYEVLRILIWQKESSIYIYDLLEILKGWLPEKELSPEEYSLSNQAALFLLAAYCKETILGLDPNEYGKWPSTYVLFAGLYDDSDSACKHKLNILVSWLFYPDTDPSKNSERKLALEHLLKVDPIDWIGFFIAEWFAILCGSRKGRIDTQSPYASKVADSLLEQVVLATEPAEQKRLTEFWATLANTYLDEAEKCANSGEEQRKKDFVFRRKLVRELRKRFKSLQKETVAIE